MLGDEDEAAFACENGTVDVVGISTGAGNDEVSVSSYFRYPDLGLKQIFSPSKLVFMNVFLGAGRDRFATGPGTDAVFGGPGKDLIAGGSSNDLMRAGQGPRVAAGG